MSEQSGRNEPPGRRRQQDSDVLSDLQRWLIRSGARSMRSQFEDQVRRTLGGQQPDSGDVWDVATTEIPPEVGESPECQWCPICRAARRMRDSRPGLGGQLSGAGDAVAAAVQDAVRAFDSLLGGRAPGDRPGSRGTEPPADSSQKASQQPEAASRPDTLAGEHGPGGWKPGDRLATAGPGVADPWATATGPGEPAEGVTRNGETLDDGPDGRGHGPSDRG